MKKLINFIVILSLSCGLLFSNQADVANKNTALRCLKLAENCLIAGDYENAFNQAELGLSYDDSISDLIYIKAHARRFLKAKKADVIKDVEEAFEKDNWVGYTVNGARILYADLLSDVGRYEESMNVLDSKPFILTADAEFIRIKNLYRMGNEQSIKDARLKVNTSRRIYKDDNRFPTIFFMFELKYMQESYVKGNKYEIPEIVKTISGSYLQDLPDYSGENSFIELMAIFFADSSDIKLNEQTRLVKAIAAKEQTSNPILALAGLKVGLYTQQQAFDMFFSLAKDTVELPVLETLALMITEDDVKLQFVEKMNNYEGSLLIDIDNDLQPEALVQYKTGRPDKISYDYNNDGVVDLYAECEFGNPMIVYYLRNETVINYKAYPSVSKFTYKDKDYSFNFLDNDFNIKPFTLVQNPIFSTFGLEFYIPQLVDFIPPTNKELIAKANEIELNTKERDNSRVVYKLLNGQPVYADFFNGDEKYAYCGFTDSFPLIRKVDYDDDGHFETEETFNLAQDYEIITEEEKNFVKDIFHPLAIISDIYLSMVRVDRNANTYYEFTQQFLGDDGYITSWDNNDDGIIDSRFIRYPMEKENNDNLDSNNSVIDNTSHIKEDSIFFDKNGDPLISINFIDKIPVKMNLQNQEVIISAGSTDNFYWIEEEEFNNSEKEEFEKYITEEVRKELSNGLIKMINHEEIRANVIMVNDNIFCKILPETYIDIEEENKEQ